MLGVGVLGTTLGCIEPAEIDTEEVGAFLQPPRAEFDPQNGRVPLPNVLLMDPATGRVSLPTACAEAPGSPAEELRASLNQLDGFGTLETSLVATFNQAVDPASLEGRVFVVRLAENGVPLQRFEGAVSVDVAPGTSVRELADCSGSVTVPNLTLLPRAPLAEASTYGVVLLSGIESQRGARFEPTSTWALVRQAQPPVQFSETDPPVLLRNTTPLNPELPEGMTALSGLDRLWRAHEPLLTAIDQLAPALVPEDPPDRDDILLAWAFHTQTLSAPFDPDVAGSPAATLEETPATLALPPPAAGAGAPLGIEDFFAAALPEATCSALACEAIGAVYAESPASVAPTFTAPSFLTGDDCASGGAPLGASSDPLEPALVCQRRLPLVLVLPAEPPGPNGYGTVIFGHGFGRSKEDLLALAGTLAQGGLASVAFDAVDHGARAVQISTAPELGCDRTGPDRPCERSFGPTCAPQCFAAPLSANLAVARDHLRQTLLDQQQLERVLAACAAPGTCGALHVDPERIAYVGHSLGALIGGVNVAVSRHLRAAVLNAGGADWVKVLSETASPELRCPLVDALIESGVLIGESWENGSNPDATCLSDSFRSERGFLEFAAAARWMLDPADPANYAARYRAGGPPVLVAEVVSDPVVPNSATRLLGDLAGLSPEPAAPATSPMPAPSPATTRPGSSWLRYGPLAADPSRAFPGNVYGHGSLLAPVEPAPGQDAASGELGTLQMRADTLAFLLSHM